MNAGEMRQYLEDVGFMVDFDADTLGDGGVLRWSASNL